MAVPAMSFSAPRRLIEPSASPLARSSKKLSSLAIGRASFQKGAGPVSPAELRNVAKYEGLQGLAQVPNDALRKFFPTRA